MFIFTIKGKVKAKQSVKFGRNGIKYTPADVKEYANYVKWCFKETYPLWDAERLAGKALNVFITVYCSIPKSFSKKKYKEATAGVIRPTVKPDCDNIAKNICDALNGVAYPDDRQIVSLIIAKHYTICEERVIVEIKAEDTEKVERRLLGLEGQACGKA